MKKKIFILMMSLLAAISVAQGQKMLPAVSLQSVDGKQINTGNLGLKGPVVITFWASWCATCKREMAALNEVYTDWKDETGVTIVAVSVDDEKTKNNVAPMVNANGWEFLVLLDPNGDFKRAMGVSHTPHTFLVNEKGEIVYARNNYTAGDEDLLYEELLKLKKSQQR